MSTSSLAQARSLKIPSYDDTLIRKGSVADFWEDNAELLKSAWKEWEDEQIDLPKLDDCIFDEKLQKAIGAAWEDPTNEDAVKDLWEEVTPGVYKTQFFDPEKLAALRTYFDKADNSGVPMRPPYGILLNRGGVMIDPRSVGYFAAPSFQAFYQNLMTSYMRPLGRLMAPEYINDQDDSQSFGFSIEYQPTTEQGIRMHSDSSALTLNINMNLPGEEWEGSSLIFVDPDTHERKIVEFGHGVAVMHRGAIPHAALPLTSGIRKNLVLWLYGQNGRVNRHFPYNEDEQLSQAMRWAKPEFCIPQDSWAPF